MFRKFRLMASATQGARLFPLTLATLVHAAPQGGSVVSGQATIQQSTSFGKTSTTVVQTSPKASVNWQSFNIASGESVRFVQPDASSVIVNRISDPQPSRLLGQLSANGQVWLINPAGIYFGPGAQVNVGGLLASTLNLSDATLPLFLKGPVNAGQTQTQVVNDGQLQTAQGGYVGLLGAQVSNTGDIRSPNGRIMLLGDGQNGSVNLSGTLNVSGNNHTSGWVETSAAQITISEKAKVLTRNSDGSMGTWLIDPTDFTISSGSGALTANSIGATTLSNSLDSANVSIATSSDNANIYVNSALSWSAATQLSLSAGNSIYINAPISASNNGQLKLLYGQTAGSGDYYVNAPVSLTAGNHFFTQLGTNVADLKSYQVITSLGNRASTTATDLQGINGNLTANYALGADIDASASKTWHNKVNHDGFTKIGDNDNLTGSETFFSGTFAGLGHVVSDLYMYQPNIGVSGMFAGLSATGVIRDTGLVNMDITTNSSGGLVGRNRGTVRTSFSTGSITSKAGFVGGLVGDNSTGTGTVQDSYSSANVIVSNSALIPAGGLVGRNYSSITNSYASGQVSGTSGYTGGLIGELKNTGSITASVWNTTTSGQSSAYASVSVGSSSGATGLSTSEMKQSSNYSGWNFTTPWIIYNADTAPLLRAFMTPLSISAYASGTKVYDGTTSTTAASYTDPGSLSKTLLGTVSFVLDGSDVGTHSVIASGLYSDQLGYQISYAFSTNSVTITSAVSATVPRIDTTVSQSPTEATSPVVPAALAQNTIDPVAGSDTTTSDTTTSDTTTSDTSTTLPNINAVESDLVGLPPAVVSNIEQNEQITFNKQSQRTVPAISEAPARRATPSVADESAEAAQNWRTELSLDNHGSSYSGQQQAGLHQQHHHLLKPDDTLDLNLLLSDEHMQFARWAYAFPWQSNNGLRLGLASSYLTYRLGGSASSLNAYGSANQQSVWAEQPLINTPTWQTLWRVQYEQSSLRDLETTSASDNDRRTQVLHLSTGLTHTNFTGAGQQWLNLDAGLGYLGFNNDTAQSLDSTTANTQGAFQKLNLSAGWQQTFDRSLWSVNWQSQWSNRNLDNSQKMSVGGAHSVRAYAPGALSADNGHLLSTEFKHPLSPAERLLNPWGQWFAGGFVDVAWLTLYRHPYSSDNNQARLSGCGVFLSWQGPRDWQGKISFSKAFGSTPSQLSGSSDEHPAAWLELSKAFH